MYRLLILLCLFPLLAGCATVGSLRPGSGSTFEVYDRSYDEIWKATVSVISRNLTIVESNKDGGAIKAEARAGIATWGEVVGVFITPISRGEKKYTVEVLSLKRSMGQITGQNWAPGIIAGIKAELNI